MNVPLSWLGEYVDLPKDTKVLTDKLTMVGHMLDKTIKKGDETVIDLELRGNRADMFGLIGVARDISAILHTPLKLPTVAPLPKTDPKSPLVEVRPDAKDLVQRYTALHLKVQIGTSPDWMIKHLNLYGIPSINNIVDITNYVMVETGIPMHAFDYHKIEGGKLLLRRGKTDEEFQTIQQGLTVKLTNQDLVIADSKNPLTLTMIGGLSSKVSTDTSEIILEAAVYNPGSCRRSARRLKIFTESGNRLEKHLDPNQVSLAMSRALYLLKQHAQAKELSLVSDYYPNSIKPKSIKFDETEIARLSGIQVKNWQKVLESLGFEVKGNTATVPTYRTDIEGSADLVEEIVRIYGYDHIPETPIASSTPVPATYQTYEVSEKLRTIITSLGFNEAITLTMVNQGEVSLINPPDPDLKWLRATIHPSLTSYATRLLNLRQSRVCLFEVGKCFTQSKGKYREQLKLSLVMAGITSTKHWNTIPNTITAYDLRGVLDRITQLLGVETLDAQTGKTDNVYWAEINVDELLSRVPPFVNPYAIVSNLTPIIEDVNINLVGSYQKLIDKIQKCSPLIKQIELIDKYEDKLTLRLTYHSDSKQLSNEDIASIRIMVLQNPA